MKFIKTQRGNYINPALIAKWCIQLKNDGVKNYVHRVTADGEILAQFPFKMPERSVIMLPSDAKKMKLKPDAKHCYREFIPISGEAAEEFIKTARQPAQAYLDKLIAELEEAHGKNSSST